MRVIPNGRRALRRCAAAVVAAVALGLLAVLTVGNALVAPNPHPVGELPADLTGESVEIASESGSLLRGWLLRGEPGAGVVVLLHSLHGSRLSMLPRARFLSKAGFSVLLVDLQANGESPGERATFGYLESRDARAAVDFARASCPGERVGILGASLGAASAVLASPPLDVDALILEAMYPTIDEAVADRIAIRLGAPGRLLSPLLLEQLGMRLGVGPDDLRPIDCVGSIRAPKLILAGTEDRHTTIAESRAIFASAAEPKELWEVDGAAHVDLHRFAGDEYERRVEDFLREHLTR